MMGVIWYTSATQPLVLQGQGQMKFKVIQNDRRIIIILNICLCRKKQILQKVSHCRRQQDKLIMSPYFCKHFNNYEIADVKFPDFRKSLEFSPYFFLSTKQIVPYGRRKIKLVFSSRVKNNFVLK
jgi:hypothetical protein